mgnify:CR=1 FL=1
MPTDFNDPISSFLADKSMSVPLGQVLLFADALHAFWQAQTRFDGILRIRVLLGIHFQQELFY